MAPDPTDEDRKAALRSQIDENLRRIYHTALEDAVPERFARLLQQLRESAAGAPPAADAELAPSQTLPPSPSRPETGS